MRLVIALSAAFALLVLNGFLIQALFLYRPTGGEVLGVVMLAGCFTAIVLRRRWLFIATQNAMTILVIVRLLQWEAPAEGNETLGAVFSFFFVVVLGNVLAWLVTRAIPHRRPV